VSTAATNMANKISNQDGNLFKAVLMTHVILILHLLIIAGLVLMVIFFRSVTQHFLWILLGATVLFLLTAFIVIRRIKSNSKKVLRDIKSSSHYGGRAFEVSFLRGLVSLKVGQQNDQNYIENHSSRVNLQLEDPKTVQIRELTELARLYEKKLISAEEYDRTKKLIMKSL
jgi:glucan phosphoethanolaminetransferase (alkaline phosphatase superfamily)